MIRLIVVAAASIGLILFVAFVVSRLLRTRTRGMSIRMQVFLALAVIVGAFAFGLGLMVIDRVEARAVRLARQAAFDEARSMSGMLAAELDRTGVDVRVIARRLEQERRRGSALRLELLDEQSRVLYPAGRPSAKDEAGSVFVDAPIVVSGRFLGSVRVVKPTVVVKNLLADFAPTVLVISLVLGAAAALAAAWIGRAIASPIEALSSFAERVSGGERSAPPALYWGSREVVRLARSIDSMRRQLEGRPFVETFAADLSHELKNPVAAIRASAEVLEESALDEPDQARRFVGRIREAAERIERLLRELLSLARIEARGVESLELLDLTTTVRAVANLLRDSRVRVSLGPDRHYRVYGSGDWLQRAIHNLVDNALVHSPPGSAVTVRLDRRDAEVQLEVESDGAIPKHVRERLFRRFVTTRPDKGGSGLGLSIVRAVAEAHSGNIELLNSGPPAVVFRLTLPSARPTAQLSA